MSYQPAPARYDTMTYRRCGRSGLKLPAVSLGLWHNFGGDSIFENMRAMCRTAFDLGITHFDLANNYGPPPGSAEENFGALLKSDFRGLRDELIISTKAGYLMWPGPYGEWGSRKYLLASLDQSLKRMGLDHVDIFYSHRVDPDTPLEETMGALDAAVRQGKALYVGVSSYSAARTGQAAKILRELGTPCVIHHRLAKEGVGCIAFSPLAQGMLSTKYLKGMPAGSRAMQNKSLSQDHLSEEAVKRIGALNDIAKARGQSLAQMAVAWVLRDERMTSALIGASRPEQIKEIVGALKNTAFTKKELGEIDKHAKDSDINLWKRSSTA
jgi:L-glyceraldehyde 3-phosphate reductase